MGFCIWVELIIYIHLVRVWPTRLFLWLFSQNLFENFWYVDSASVSLTFIQSFENNFPQIKFLTRTTPFGYDSFNILVEAFENGRLEPVECLNNLNTYHGVAGGLTKTPEGRFDSPAGVWMIKDGKPTPVNE